VNVFIAQGSIVAAAAAACAVALLSLLSGHGVVTLAVRAGCSFALVGLAARLAGQLLAPLVLEDMARAEAAVALARRVQAEEQDKQADEEMRARSVA